MSASFIGIQIGNKRGKKRKKDKNPGIFALFALFVSNSRFVSRPDFKNVFRPQIVDRGWLEYLDCGWDIYGERRKNPARLKSIRVSRLFSLAGVNFDDTTTEKDALDIILRQKGLNFTPGDEWLYSNSGYFLLSIIIKRASGKSFAEFAKENIFDPLGMTHTLILDNHKRIAPMRATGYSPNPKGGFQTEMSNFEQIIRDRPQWHETTDGTDLP
jgi:hypothetical protein